MEECVQLEVEFQKWDRFEEAADFRPRDWAATDGQDAAGWVPRLSDAEYADQVQAQQCEVVMSSLTQWLIVEMRRISRSPRNECAPTLEFRQRVEGGAHPGPTNTCLTIPRRVMSSPIGRRMSRDSWLVVRANSG